MRPRLAESEWKTWWEWQPTLSWNEPERTAGREASIGAVDLSWAAFAAALIPLGLLWDFSWECSIGVDRYWSPPHIATYAGVWLGGVLGAKLVVACTLAQRHGCAAQGVRVGPWRGPSGAWVLLWSAVLWQGASLFDGWWQRAYGLGAGLWHPPQILKAAGFFGELFGALMLCRAARAGGCLSVAKGKWLSAWHGGLLVTLCALMLTMTSYPNLQHTGSFYLLSCGVYPAVLLASALAGRERWGATRAALVYMALVCSAVWLLPLFPAHPLTAPIYNATDHLMPPPFPLLLGAPALAMDGLRLWLETKTRVRRVAWLAVLIGVGFLAVFLPVQWFFAEFLLSPVADDPVFAGGGQHWPFFLKIDQARVMFWDMKRDPLNWRAAALALLLAVVSAWVGVRVGKWLSKLRR